MTEIEQLQEQLRNVEKERDELKDRFEHLEVVIQTVSEKLERKERELTDLKWKKHVNEENGEPQSISAIEYAELRDAVKDLIEQNREKDVKIEELHKAVSTYQKVEEIILNSHSPRRSKSASADADNAVHSMFSHSSAAVNGRASGTTSRMPTSPVHTDISAPPIPKRALSVQRSNSYDSSKFHRIVQTENYNEDSRRKASSTSLPRDYGNRINTSVVQSKLDGDNNESDVFTDDEVIIPKEPKKKKLLKRFFARMRRTTSQEVVGDGKPFKRGGVRATAGPRLGGSRVNSNNCQTVQSDSFLKPFASWSIDQVCIWLHDIGLSMYVNDCRKWCKNGQHILESSSHEIEKELKITHILHRKKLKLALQAMKSSNNKEVHHLGGLKTDWITKWLDDIGLPQYKDQFYEARIDGRMLNHMTVDDLLHMKINNTLHHMSIRRGIEVLREHNFNLATLKRRPSLERSFHFPSTTLNGLALDNKERDVSLWTNHRVMEWLRMIDLSEYAVNLRGSGVHGGLIMLEPRFTVEHLANILIIPTSKTLLRRHLSGHFVNLVGQQVQGKKREMEQIPSMALTLNMKVKSRKTNLFRKGRPTSEYICPMQHVEAVEVLVKAASADETRRVKSAVAMYKKELSKRESKESPRECTVKTSIS